MEDLLPAYRDAVILTSALGLQYLWIDSLCIIQDDQYDKEIQIANMGNVYLNSYMTIATDTYRHHTETFFSERPWQWRAHKESIHIANGSECGVYFRERPDHSLGWTGIFERGW